MSTRGRAVDVRRLWIVFSGAAAIIVTLGVLRVVTRAAPRPARDGAQAATGRLTLQQQAAAAGGVLRRTVRFVPMGQPHTLAELAALADLIVDGEVRMDRCLVVGSGRAIETVAEIQVKSVLKGTETTGTVYVAMPGGQVRFADGSIAEVEADDYVRPIPGNRVVAFLWSAPPPLSKDVNPTGGKLFVPVSEQLGLYDLSFRLEPFVIPVGLAHSELAKRVAKTQMSADLFVQQVRSLSK